MELDERLDNHSVRLGSAETLLKTILGNGQPGRLQDVENDVRFLSKMVWIGFGLIAALQFLAANGMLTLVAKR